jgi:hypothetical protein
VLADFKQLFLEGENIYPERVVPLEDGEDPVFAYGTSWMLAARVVTDKKEILEIELTSSHNPPSGFCINASIYFPLLFWVLYHDEAQDRCGMYRIYGGEISFRIETTMDYEVEGRKVMMEDGAWVFIDDRQPLGPDEEDRVVPVNPLYLPHVYDRVPVLIATEAREDGCSICIGGKDD